MSLQRLAAQQDESCRQGERDEKSHRNLQVMPIVRKRLCLRLGGKASHHGDVSAELKFFLPTFSAFLKESLAKNFNAPRLRCR
jgi:hypothetical protein